MLTSLRLLLFKLTLYNYAKFLILPTFVYKINYPKPNHKIRIMYLLKKVFYGSWCIVFFYMIVSDFTMPVSFYLIVFW